MAQPGSVWLRGGTYYLSEKLVFSAEDSGSQAASVVYYAYGQELPVISGGVRLPVNEWGENSPLYSPHSQAWFAK